MSTNSSFKALIEPILLSHNFTLVTNESFRKVYCFVNLSCSFYVEATFLDYHTGTFSIRKEYNGISKILDYIYAPTTFEMQDSIKMNIGGSNNISFLKDFEDFYNIEDDNEDTI